MMMRMIGKNHEWKDDGKTQTIDRAGHLRHAAGSIAKDEASLMLKCPKFSGMVLADSPFVSASRARRMDLRRKLQPSSS
jgi:hypothetical protein